MSSTRAPVKDTLGSLQYLIWHESLHTWKETSTRAPPPPADWAWALCINQPILQTAWNIIQPCMCQFGQQIHQHWCLQKTFSVLVISVPRLEQIETSAVQILESEKMLRDFSSWPICFPWHSWGRPFFRRSWSGSGAYKKRIGLRKPWKGVFKGRR